MSAGGYCDLLESSTVLGISARTAVLALPSFHLGSLQSWDPLQAQKIFSHLLWFRCFKERLVDCLLLVPML